jgi:hypothetical protein
MAMIHEGLHGSISIMFVYRVKRLGMRIRMKVENKTSRDKTIANWNKTNQKTEQTEYDELMKRSRKENRKNRFLELCQGK